MPQILTPALEIAKLPGSQFVIWQSGSQYRMDIPALIAAGVLGLGTANQILGMNAAGTALEWKTFPFSNWTAYTPTATGFGTPTNMFGEYQQINDTLRIRAKFTSGVATAVEARLSLPAGFTSSASKVPTIQMAGACGLQGTVPINALIESNIGYLTFARGDVAGMTKANASTFISTGLVLSVMAEVPI